jgi:hypothetical protein
MAALAAAAAATQKMATPTLQPVSTPATTPLTQTGIRVITPQQLIQTTSGQTIKLASGSVQGGQQAIRLITPGQSPMGAKQIIVQKAGQGGTGQPQLMTLVKTAQGLTLAPAGAKGIGSGQVVKLVASQAGGQKGGTPTIIQASQSQLIQIANTATNATAGQKVISTIMKTMGGTGMCCRSTYTIL